jgi:tRNA nucleotidyltransferase (CCA-adding enzyme)
VEAPPAAQLAARLGAQPRTARLAEAFADTPGAHLVGGAVRDLLLDGAPVDLDLVVEGDGPAAARAAAERLGGEVREHGRFATATVTAGELAFDVVTARAESYPRPGALPEVRPGTLEEDLARRDFTVNAMALSLHRDTLGGLRWFPGALDDLEAGVLRILHPRSFRDDPTRLLRLVRYGARLGFDPDARTDALARDALADGALAAVSTARVGGELRLLCAEPNSPAALARVHALGLEGALHESFEARPDLAERALGQLPHGTDRGLVALAACCTRFQRGPLAAWLDGLELTSHERDAVVEAALEAEEVAERLRHAHRPSLIAAAARSRHPETLALAAALNAGEAVARWNGELR